MTQLGWQYQLTQMADEEKTVSFRVFLADEERTRFKVECAKEKTTMSQKVRELIRQWLEQEPNSSEPNGAAKTKKK